MVTPNFFMPGAPKCGTTAMARYLGEHPGVVMSTPKEPRYFGRHSLTRKVDLALKGPHNDLESYLALFSGADERHTVVGEATTTYLMDPRAIDELAAFAPEAKILVMLRNPVDLVYAFHSELLLNASETESDFRVAWGLQEARAAGREVPRSARAPGRLLYGQIGMLGRQVEHLLTRFPREQVKIVLFDDFRDDVARTYRSVLEFLDLPDDGRTTFDVVNPGKQFDQTSLMRWLKSDTVLRSLSQRAKHALGRDSWGLYQRMLQRRSSVTSRPPLDPDFRASLTQFFRDDVLTLEQLTGYDLSAWRAVRGPTSSDQG